MFFKKKLNNEESNYLLEAILPLLNLSNINTINAIKILLEDETLPQKKIVRNIIKKIEEDGNNYEDAFLDVGLIKESEYSIIKSSGELKNVIKDILEARKISLVTEIEILKASWKSMGVILSVFLFYGFGMPTILNFIEKTLGGGKSTSILGVKVQPLDMPIFLSNPLYWEISFYLTILIFIIIIFAYILLYRKNTKMLYFFLKTKAYDDMPRLFRMMIALRRANLNTTVLAEEIAQFSHPQGLAPMWSRIAKTQNYSEAFRLYNFPKEIVSITNIYDITNNLYDHLEDMIKICKDRVEQKKQRIRKIGNVMFLITLTLAISTLVFTFQYLILKYGSSMQNLSIG